MDLFSIWRSSSLEILYSKRIVTILYALAATMILAHMVLASSEFFGAYYTFHMFSVSTEAFIWISLLLFLPFWVTGAIIARACIQRLRLSVWIRRAVKLVGYETKFGPVEAGYLVDYEYSHRELTATLLDLHFRNIIKLVIDDEMNITISPADTTQKISDYEYAYLVQLDKLASRQFQSFSDRHLIKVGKKAHKALVDGMIKDKIIQKEQLPRRSVRILFRFLYAIAGFVAAVYLQVFITRPQSIFEDNELTHPVSILQVLILAVIITFVIMIIASSLWPRLAKDYKTSGYVSWIDATGLLMYIRAVFKDRFADENITLQDASTLRQYSAYAVAYGVVPSTPEAIAKILRITDNS